MSRSEVETPKAEQRSPADLARVVYIPNMDAGPRRDTYERLLTKKFPTCMGQAATLLESESTGGTYVFMCGGTRLMFNGRDLGALKAPKGEAAEARKAGDERRAADKSPAA